MGRTVRSVRTVRTLARQDRAERLRAVIAALRDRYGPRIIRLGATSHDTVDRIASGAAGAGWPPLTTGSLGLDLLTGGLPRGGITELAGEEGAGTGTLSLAALAACQRVGGLALLVDAEAGVDPDSLVAVGVDPERLLLACPATAAEAWDVLLALCRCGALHLLLLSSLPGLLALPGSDAPSYRPARGLRRLRTALRGRGTALLLTNRPVPGPPGSTVGGAALAQAAALRIALRRDRLLYAPSGEVAALRALARVVKHHGLPRDPALALDITPGGPRRAAELIALGRLLGCIQEHPLGLISRGRVLGKTPARAAAELERDAELAGALERQVRAAWAGCGGIPRRDGVAR